MSRKNFDFPLGIRLWPNEGQGRTRRIAEGYSFSPLENSTDSFRFSAMVGSHKVEPLFRSMAQSLPEESFFILEFYQEEMQAQADEQPSPVIYYSPYLETSEILDTIAPYLPRLIHDGFVGFGLANNRAGMEIFYSEEKVFTCFTGNHIRAMDLFSRNGLRHNPEQLFPTDFGHDHLSLLCHARGTLPEPFRSMGEVELDYDNFCADLTDLLDMYPVEDNLSFFLSKKEQDLIEERLLSHEEFSLFAEEDFGSLLLDWNDFVGECETGFTGDLWEYREGLKLRDMIQFVIEGISSALQHKILDIIADADAKLQKNLVDRRKRLDPPLALPASQERFWYAGMVRNQGADLRRDLIRVGWYKP
ncbi:hypothetical protein DESUT3_01250 [Desulfuromonas versatilis]|uniref:Uncharacterized protein n=1 Tax=Desulfuromonas versatilis TaxID=2802975 RepID=A0ABN6DV50_9BACT|nr:hypothetical protein [Desulfuromonas versatilis]BCR03056.1 hypothetical protein DESUT3_01250 [Desulfuromonas versatilis]